MRCRGASWMDREANMSKLKAVLFDFDGTLMNTNELIIQSWQHVFKKIRGHEADRAVIKSTFGEILWDTMRKFFPEEDPDEMVAIYREYQRNINEEPILMFDGMEELVAELRSRGVLMGIVTSRLWSSSLQGKYKFDVAHLFDALVSAADTNIHKPNPEPCLICLDKLGVSPEEAILIGDTKFDIECARNAGVRSVLVGWSLQDGEKLREEYAPDYYVEDVAELRELLLEKLVI